MSQKISHECLIHAVNLLNCQFNLNLMIKKNKSSYIIAPENDISQLEDIYISIEKNENKDGYFLRIKNTKYRFQLEQFSKIIGKKLKSFSLLLEDDILCEIPSILCKLAKTIQWN